MSKAYNSELQTKVEQFLKEKGISQAKAKDQGVSNSLPKPFGPFAQRRKYNADNIGILIVRQSDNFDNVDYSFLRPYLYQLTYDKKYYDPAVL